MPIAKANIAYLLGTSLFVHGCLSQHEAASRAASTVTADDWSPRLASATYEQHRLQLALSPWIAHIDDRIHLCADARVAVRAMRYAVLTVTTQTVLLGKRRYVIGVGYFDILARSEAKKICGIRNPQ